MAEAIANREVRILQLANLFPCLRAAPGVGRGLWDAVALDKWAAAGASSGEKHSARFVLGVWNPYEAWECGLFNVFDAIGVWDDQHRSAFEQWVAGPWFA